MIHKIKHQKLMMKIHMAKLPEKELQFINKPDPEIKRLTFWDLFAKIKLSLGG